jgi:hypothetical protein
MPPSRRNDLARGRLNHPTMKDFYLAIAGVVFIGAAVFSLLGWGAWALLFY